MSTQSNESYIELNLVRHPAWVGGLVLMGIAVALAGCCALWVYCHRTDPIVRAKQPLFLLLLCFGDALTSLSIYPLGSNESNSKHLDANCLLYPWLSAIGGTIIWSSLFTKLMRVNRIFHAGSHQRVVVKAKDVMRPFITLLTINLTCLIALSVFAAPKWTREPYTDDPNSTLGYCKYNGLGSLFTTLLFVVNTTALVMLCRQAYRAREIRAEFSEARGVALAVFSILHGSIIVGPTAVLLEADNATARHVLLVMQNFMNSVALLLNIIGPLVYQQRKSGRSGGLAVQRVTGINNNRTTTPTARLESDVATEAGHHHNAEKMCPQERPDQEKDVENIEAPHIQSQSDSGQ